MEGLACVTGWSLSWPGCQLPVGASLQPHIFREPKRAQGQSCAFHSYKGLSPKPKF